ncbi:MAG: CDP-alcohol phosphatidyltransferase family protein, partial [Clostridia bacterium]
MKFEKKDLFTIPNILTYIRFACVPIFLWLMIEYKLDATKYSYLFSAFALFICASITDIVDGAIARNHNMTSDIGKIIDPLADKMLQVTAIIMLTVVGNFHWIFTAIVFVKELYLVLMTKFYMVAGKYQINQHSNAWGKVAAVMVFVAILFGFAAGLHEILMWMTNSLCVIAVGFALFAA